MPADQLTPVDVIDAVIAKILTGTSVAQAASTAGIPTATLADAIEVYRQAGRRALHEHVNPGWWQVYIRFTDWDRSEHTATEHLAPLLQHAKDNGTINCWWFIRKHPCWRLRLHHDPGQHTMTGDLVAALDRLTRNGDIDSWWPGIYEPETAAFGGTPGIDIAHDLFCADSNAILTLFNNHAPPLGRRELSLLLCGTLMRAAGLEWYEQGDVWHRIAEERPVPADIRTSKITQMADGIKDLLLTETSPDGPLLGATGPLAFAADWAEAFRRSGRALGLSTQQGALQRGLRNIISYLVIFHWNRLGLHVRTQSILATAARTAVLDRPLLTSALRQ